MHLKAHTIKEKSLKQYLMWGLIVVGALIVLHTIYRAYISSAAAGGAG